MTDPSSPAGTRTHPRHQAPRGHATATTPDWLQHLPTDRRGIPVPTINHWGREDSALLRIAHDPHVGAAAVYLEEDLDGDPDFTRQNMARQRESVVTGRCQVCWRHVPWSRRHLVVADMSVQWVRLGRRPAVPVVTEPWLCERCAHFAARRCPALIRRSRTERLTIVQISSRRDVEVVLSRGWVEGDLEAESRQSQPVMWAKLALLRVQITPAAPPCDAHPIPAGTTV